jgi:hypothetical protein
VHLNPSLLPDLTRWFPRPYSRLETHRPLEANGSPCFVWEGQVHRRLGFLGAQVLPEATIILAVNQLELHVYSPQKKLLTFMAEKGIRPGVLPPWQHGLESIQGRGLNHGVEPFAVLLAYLSESYFAILTKRRN